MHKMSSLNPKIKASRNSLKHLYYIICGFAITEAMLNIFLGEDTIVFFLEDGIIDPYEVSTLFLGISFFCMIIRLVHGHSMHLEITYGTRFKITLDIILFLCQTPFIYLMAITLKYPIFFAWSFLILLIIDSSWLIVLIIVIIKKKGRGFLEKIERYWLIIDVILILSLIYVAFITNFDIPIFSIYVIIILIISTIVDYSINHEFYLPLENKFEYKSEGVEIKLEMDLKHNLYTIRVQPNDNWKITDATIPKNQDTISIKIQKLEK